MLDILGLVQSVLVNSVSVLGVYAMRWPVGTALALYWFENAISSFLIVASLAMWKRTHGSATERPRYSIGEVAGTCVVFNVAHIVFLLAFLGVMLPRYAAAERFDRRSFTQGAIVIGVLLLLGFVFTAVRMRTIDALEMQQRVMRHLQRITVLHLAIVIGMFGVLIFGGIRVFFAIFATLKVIADLSWRFGPKAARSGIP